MPLRLKTEVQIRCPVCKTLGRLGKSHDKFETIVFPDALVCVCRDCNWPAATKRVFPQDRPR